ncbi:MAG: UV damage endonuclease UvsE [Candidatus Parcubacteria bacterium]|nr:MAG: UV damage endonuclease UvsE [Candidatus Parcubacteria bacterium]
MISFKNIKFNYGFICSTYKSYLSTNHSFRLKNLNKINILKTVEKNLEDFIELLKLSKKLNCGIFRLGSQFIPFASHPNFNKEWLKDIRQLINNYLEEIKKFNIRITMHPGQYTILSTENKSIIKRSLNEIKYHFWLLDELELNENSIVVIHLGGIYGDKEKTKKIFIKNVKINNWLKSRLAIENDERCYHAKELIEIAKELSLPIVFDWFHHQLNHSVFSLIDLIETWGNRTPEMHISSGSKINKYGHADYVNFKDFLNFLSFLNENSKSQKIKIDILFEAKKKELAIKKFINNCNKFRFLECAQ